MYRLIPISKFDDIPLAYWETPIGLLLAYHNFNHPLSEYTQAHLLIGICMDNRKRMRIPDNFAYLIRSGGGNLRYSGFKVSYAIAVGGVTAIALIGHNNCGMVNLIARKERFLQGLVENILRYTLRDIFPSILMEEKGFYVIVFKLSFIFLPGFLRAVLSKC